MADPAAYSQDDDTQKKTDELLHGIGLHPAQQRAQEYLWQHAQARGGPQEVQGLSPGVGGGGGDLIASNQPPQPVQPVTKPGFKTLTEQDFRDMQNMGQNPASVLPPGSSVHISGQPTQVTPPGVTPPATTPSRQLGQESLGETQQQAENIMPRVLMAGTGATGAPPAVRSITPVDPNLIKSSEGRTAADLAEEQRLLTSGPGVRQIKNPFLRRLAEVGDVAGSIIAPRAMAAIPGTTMHHAELVSGAYGRTKEDLAEREKLAQTQEAVARGEATAAPKYHMVPGMESTAGEPLQEEEKSGEVKTVPGAKLKPTAGRAADQPLTDPDYSQRQLDTMAKAFGVTSPQLPANPTQGEYTQAYQALKAQMPGKSDDFWKGYDRYIKENAMQDNATNLLAFRKQWEAQQGPRGQIILGPPDEKGNRQAIAVQPGTTVAPGSSTIAGAQPSATMRNAGERANLTIRNLDRLTAKVDEFNDLVGPGAGRWNDFITGKLGMDDPAYASLMALDGLVSSGATLAHSIGRMPVVLLDRFEQNGRLAQSPGDILAVMKELRTALVDIQSAGGGNLPPASATPPQLPSEKKAADEKAAQEQKRQKLGGGAGRIETPQKPGERPPLKQIFTPPQ